MSNEMGWGQALALGILQGLTEFLPISSSGHLVLGQAALGLREPELLFGILVHMGTLAAVLAIYGKDVWRILRAWLRLTAAQGEECDKVSRRAGSLIVLGTIPATLFGLFFQETIESAFSNPKGVAYSLIITGFLLFTSSRKSAGGRGEAKMTWRDALVIGLFQAAAILPGISRSGATIAAALFMGIEREQAARFSFLLSVPAICGAFVLKAQDLQAVPPEATATLIVGAVASAATGLLALIWLLRLLRRGNLGLFAYYCWAAGIAAIMLG